MIGLFGDEIKDVPKKMGYIQKWRRANNYRASDGKDRCKVCDNIIRFSYHGRVYYKCKELGITNSNGTDILLKNVCNLFIQEVDI